MSLKGRTALVTGASMGIGEHIAASLAEAGANLILFSRSEEKLEQLREKLSESTSSKVIFRTVDVGNLESVNNAVSSCAREMGGIDILVNNAGLALGAPNPFYNLKPDQILTMNNTNVNGLMFVSHTVLNHAMLSQNAGTILNVTSITGLEVPPFPGEAVYHANKACQEAFTNAMRNELNGTNIRVLAIRPGCVATNFHSQRVGHDKRMYDQFFEGFEPLIAPDIARAVVFMLEQPLNVSIKVLDVVPSAQRSIAVFDRKWDERQK
ncbi:SDR family oxidoreductase [Aspergillus brunneoviolaceus CBS 621.78]|uniref:NAD(P)-binding protein n=1 Tax=Aspergillus brunneoviolaceus CBS 621.78 TaxID=1450534 RepID=A0ACD1GKE9_9EURO|nr:NAD(P)-binding protein [Aspergillus brunneoviolaceus CBS 621.78]RAH49738.1 NAD(P)-binding protein [Aspergillus brunneoviolaceus CBS 621.78]